MLFLVQSLAPMRAQNIGGANASGALTLPGGLNAQAVTGQFNVKAYGAKGDNSTDDTANVNAAVTAAGVSGGTVYFPGGTYLTSTGITLPDTNPVNIICDGRDTATIKLTSPQTAVIFKGNGGLTTGNVIADCQIDGNLNATYGLRLLQGKSWTIERLRIQKVTVSTGEGMTLGETAVSTAEFYQARILNIDTAFESGTYTTSNRPLYGIHFLQSATDNQVAFFEGWNMTNAGIQDDASDNRYDQIHVYGFPLTTYYPNYAMDILSNASVTHLVSDGVLLAGVHARGKWITITNSMFQWPTGGTVSGAFPVLADAGVDYFNFSNNAIFQAKAITIGGTQTAVSFNGSLTPPNNATVMNNSGTDDSGVGLNLVDFFPKQQFSMGGVTPRGAIVFASPFTSQPTVVIRKITSQSADLLDIFDTDGSTVLAKLDVSGNDTEATYTATAAGAASTPSVSATGAPFTGGSGTTTVPLVYYNDGAAPSTWSTSGTYEGINAPSGFSGNLVDYHVNGGSSVFHVLASGSVVSGGNYTGFNFNMTSGHLFVSSTAPTVAAAGCGGSGASVTASNGTAAFKINVGTSNTGACTVSLPTASAGWVCLGTDITTTSTTVSQTKQSGAGANNSVTLQNYTDISGTGAWTDSDVLAVSCHAY